MSQIREALLVALEQSDVVVVSGDTGSGKTTQVLAGSRSLMQITRLSGFSRLQKLKNMLRVNTSQIAVLTNIPSWFLSRPLQQMALLTD